ncbi:MAG TPA: hypothetical protein VMY42_20790 [Thermoguttaceae bacterium]|nr:hypothetical protein [Thermoguttaceae bacterium]
MNRKSTTHAEKALAVLMFVIVIAGIDPVSVVVFDAVDGWWRVFQVFQFRLGQQSTIVPGQLHGRQVAARRELVANNRGRGCCLIMFAARIWSTLQTATTFSAAIPGRFARPL